MRILFIPNPVPLLFMIGERYSIAVPLLLRRKIRHKPPGYSSNQPRCIVVTLLTAYCFAARQDNRFWCPVHFLSTEDLIKSAGYSLVYKSWSFQNIARLQCYEKTRNLNWPCTEENAKIIIVNGRIWCGRNRNGIGKNHSCKAHSYHTLVFFLEDQIQYLVPTYVFWLNCLYSSLSVWACFLRSVLIRTFSSSFRVMFFLSSLFITMDRAL